jgi:hypothetical protein
MKEVLERISEPTPKFFKKIRKIATLLVGISGAILVAPIALPTGLITAASYILFAGSAVGITASTTSTMK